MLNQGPLIEKAKNILSSIEIPGHCFLFFADIADFQLLNLYYGVEGCTGLLKSIEDHLRQSQEVVLFEQLFSDQFVFLVVTERSFTGERIKAAYDRRSKEFLKKLASSFPAYSIKISCGIYAMTSDNFDAAMDGANLARKESKRNGSISAVVFDHSILDEISKYHEEEQEIYKALKEGRFCFYLQPKVNLITGEIIGAEALARRLDINGNIFTPDSFLKIMESNGSVLDLDYLIFEQVCRHIGERLEKGLPVVRTSVNLSRLHIQNPNTVKNFNAIAKKYRVSSQYIEFELTETILPSEFDGAKKLIDQLRNCQYHVSIDDFGSGYAGINIWQELNFDTLKLDKKFLSGDEPISSRNAAIVPNIINIAQRLGVNVICEGVETEEQCHYLLQLGCSSVQGYFFSQPLPKEEFYQIYQKQNGRYKLPDWVNGAPVAPEPEPEPNGKKKLSYYKRPPRYFLFISLCAVFLAASVILTLSLNRKKTVDMFSESINENLSSYSAGKVAGDNARIEDITNTMGAFAVLVAKGRSQEFIDAYISALSENEPEVTFVFSSDEDFQQRIDAGQASESDIMYLERLKKGNTVVSEIIYSKRAGEIYCFSIGVPIFLNGEFLGGLRAIINAQELLSMEPYMSPYGRVEANFIVGGRDCILLAGPNAPAQTGDSALAIIENLRFERREDFDLQRALQEEKETRSYFLGVIDGSRYFISISPYGHNGWKHVVLFKADNTDGIIRSLFNNTARGVVGLTLAILLVCAVIIVFMRGWSKQSNADMARYLLLEQFSDTVLFDYDCRSDTIRFTPNVSRLFNADEWTHNGFSTKLELVSNIYPADRPAVEETLKGRGDKNGKPEIRIRLRHPAGNRFYWCLIQYKYIYDDSKLVSIIGKIVDIDEQQKHEDQLSRMALRDGLTGLYNRSAAADLIERYLLEDEAGLVFMIDVDDFKQINDTLGHSEGDHALQAVSECLKTAFRSNDVLCRAGGDELLVYMRKVRDPAVVRRKMNKLWRLLQEHSRKSGVTLTISVGVSRFPEDGKNFNELFQAADQSMYLVKRQGKQSYYFNGQLYSFEEDEKEV